MQIVKGLYAALIALFVALAPARAATSVVDVSDWTQVGTGTVIVNSLSTEGVWLMDSVAEPSGTTGAIYIPFGALSPALTAGATWWAHSGNSKRTTKIGVVTQAAATGASAQTGLGYSASGVAPVTGSLSANGNSASFTPLAGRAFNVSLWGMFSATCSLKRSFDGSVWVKITAGGSQMMGFAAPASEQWSEPEVGVQYRLECVVASGTVNYRISQ